MPDQRITRTWEFADQGASRTRRAVRRSTRTSKRDHEGRAATVTPTHDPTRADAAAHSKSRSAGIAYAPADFAAARIAQRNYIVRMGSNGQCGHPGCTGALVVALCRHSIADHNKPIADGDSPGTEKGPRKPGRQLFGKLQQGEVCCRPCSSVILWMQRDLRHIGQLERGCGDMPDNLDVGRRDDAVRSREHEILGQYDAATLAV